MGESSAGMKKLKMNITTGTPMIEKAQIMRYSDGLSFRSARAMSRARLAPKSRPSTTLFRFASAWLWAIRSLIGPCPVDTTASPSARADA